MGYEVLARKWRPQTFDEVVGQSHITRTLKKAVELGRLSHAYLFSGPRGCGKTSTARILAKVINCVGLENGNPCNKCDSCLGVIQGRNLDVIEIDGASHTGVNEVRDLQESIGYVPSQFANKIYIIDEVHMLSAHAFNALLKTLEEPPKHVYFIFATTAPHKIPDTIKSRCQRHHFKRLEIGEIADHLEKICKAEGVQCEIDALRLLARKAEGSMRDGESLLDQCITASSGKVVTRSVRDILGLLDFEMVRGFLETMAARDSTGVLKRLDRALNEGVDLEELSNALLEGFRDLMLLAAPGDLDDLIFRSSGDIDGLKEIVAGYELPDLITIVERLCSVGPRLKTAGDPRILLESVLVDLTLLDRQTEIRELIRRLEEAGSGGIEGREERGAAPGRGREGADAAASPFQTRSERPPKPGARVSVEVSRPTSSSFSILSGGNTDKGAGAPVAAAEDVDPATLDYDSLRKLWDGFVTFVRQKKVALGVCLVSGVVHGFSGDTITLRFAKGFSFQRDQVADAANGKFLKNMLKKYFGRELELVCLVYGEEGRAAPQERMNSKQESQGAGSGDRPLESQPIVKKIIDDFDGEIVRFDPR